MKDICVVKQQPQKSHEPDILQEHLVRLWGLLCVRYAGRRGNKITAEIGPLYFLKISKWIGRKNIIFSLKFPFPLDEYPVTVVLLNSSLILVHLPPPRKPTWVLITRHRFFDFFPGGRLRRQDKNLQSFIQSSGI